MGRRPWPWVDGVGIGRQTRAWESQAGFTLLEVLVALTILSLGVVTLIQLSSQSLRVVKVSGDYQQAVQLADRMAMEAKPTEEGVETGQDGLFQWERRTSVVPMPDEFLPKQTSPDQEPPKLFVVSIAVRWGQNQTLELATMYTPTAPPPPPQGSVSGTGTTVSTSPTGPTTPTTPGTPTTPQQPRTP
ncbi:MAG TPA: prepilin-type N-terminal cleavage/methylation domain-containing protein [Candidatus Methylomirabilis sp.]|nr:prepilin-type N-terminal cleavage/methylation domain-containing protein [Candidatus Methylomirabilis sp.]